MDTERLPTKKAGSDQTLIFLHIGKAGGSTMHGILEKQYEGVGCFFTGGGPGDNDDERISLLTRKEKEGIGVVRGHINYGVHELFPMPAVYITMLREPVDRVISHYYYIRRSPEHYLHGQCIKNRTLEEFILQTTDNDNGQTRAIAGVQEFYSFRKRLVPFGECTREHLETARRNLGSFAAVGLTERFDESVILFKNALGWEHPPLYVKRNITPDRPSRDGIPKETIRLIEEHNRLDIELYKYATELFEEQIRKQGGSFGLEVEYFRLLNGAFRETQQLRAELEKTERLSAAMETMQKSRSWRITRPLRILSGLMKGMVKTR